MHNRPMLKVENAGRVPGLRMGNGVTDTLMR